MRRIRTRLPTCSSVGFGDFFTIAFSYARAQCSQVWRDYNPWFAGIRSATSKLYENVELFMSNAAPIDHQRLQGNSGIAHSSHANLALS
jgi:hypothetical protein